MYVNIILWTRVLRIHYMEMLIYVIPHRLCLVNEQNAIINLKNDIVKNTQKPDDSKKISSDFSLENVESLQK